MLDFGEIRSWCALGEDAFIKKFPYMLGLLSRIHHEDPEKYFAEIAPYVEANWKGLHKIRSVSEWGVLGRYAPFGNYFWELSKEDVHLEGDLYLDDNISYEGLHTLKIHNQGSKENIEKLAKVLRPEVLDIDWRCVRKRDIPDIREMLSNVKDLRIREGSIDEETLLMISRIPKVSISSFLKGIYEYRSSKTLFSDIVWETEHLRVGNVEDFLKALSWDKKPLVQPYIKTLDFHGSGIILGSNENLWRLWDTFPSLENLRIYCNGSQPKRLRFSGGYFKSFEVSGREAFPVVFRDPVEIDYCSGSVENFSGPDIKIHTLEIPEDIKYRDFERVLSDYEVEHVIVPGRVRFLFPHCVKKLTLKRDRVLSLARRMELYRRFGENLEVV